MYDLAILASVIPERLPLLNRSVLTWIQEVERHTFYWNTAIGLYGEGCTIGDPYPTDYVAFGKRSGSHIAGYNNLLENIDAEIYIFTHPEILFPSGTLQAAIDHASKNTFAAFKVFWMPQHMTDNLDNYPWQTPERLESFEELYTHDPKTHGTDYWNRDVRANKTWRSTTTWAMDRATVQRLRPFPDFRTQGPDDPWFAGARPRLGIRDTTVMSPVLFHQWHPKTWRGTPAEAVQLASAELQRRFG